MRVLFIGNSHTFVHYVPLRTVEFCRQKGFPLEATMLTHPGMGLDFHLEQSQTYFNLMQGNYDAVILQHRAHPFPGEESLLDGVRRFKAITPDSTKIYLYETWSEKVNPEGQSAMSTAYEHAAREIGAALCPVGDVWHALLSLHPEEEFYFRDGQHSSVLGASLAAAVIGSTLMGKSLSVEEYFAEAKSLAEMEQDERMVDMK